MSPISRHKKTRCVLAGYGLMELAWHSIPPFIELGTKGRWMMQLGN